jgi:hypothetical protein
MHNETFGFAFDLMQILSGVYLVSRYLKDFILSNDNVEALHS